MTNEVLGSLPESSVDASGTVYDDFGATVHVCDAADSVEYLRFDCFESEPHYHYINPSEGENLICRIDEVAEGDPIAWTVGRLRDRLPEMLDLAGAHQLSARVREHQDAGSTGYRAGSRAPPPGADHGRGHEAGR